MPLPNATDLGTFTARSREQDRRFNESPFEVVSEVLRYEADTGKLYWLPRPVEMFPDECRCKAFNTQFSGKEAFTYLDPKGYRLGRLFRKPFKAHRVAWLLHTCRWPEGEIDHINGVRHDNRIINLRDVTSSENARNKSISPTNTSGACGVYWDPRKRRYMAHIGVDGRFRYLGYFDDFDAAVAARKKANAEFGFTERHGE